MPNRGEDLSTAESERAAADWERMLGEFRALGGVADNVALRHGSSGRGLFPIDPAKPFLVRVPGNLLLRSSDFAFAGERIRIREDAGPRPPEWEFFERYQSCISRGGQGYSESANLIAMFDALPLALRELLMADFGMKHFVDGDRTERIGRQFLRSRMVEWNNGTVLAPLIDLMNCSTDGVPARPAPHGGVQVEGEARSEICVRHGPHDCLGVFNRSGFASARPYAYSLPMQAKLGKIGLTIGRNVREKTPRAGFASPLMSSEGGGIHLSFLMLGQSRFPRLPRGVFYALMREAEAVGAEEAFDAILFANRTKFLKLLAALEPAHGEMVTRLRSMAHLQLEALAHCAGTREL